MVPSTAVRVPPHFSAEPPDERQNLNKFALPNRHTPLWHNHDFYVMGLLFWWVYAVLSAVLCQFTDMLQNCRKSVVDISIWILFNRNACFSTPWIPFEKCLLFLDNVIEARSKVLMVIIRQGCGFVPKCNKSVTLTVSGSRVGGGSCCCCCHGCRCCSGHGCRGCCGSCCGCRGRCCCCCGLFRDPRTRRYATISYSTLASDRRLGVFVREKYRYHQVSNIRRTLVGN